MRIIKNLLVVVLGLCMLALGVLLMGLFMTQVLTNKWFWIALAFVIALSIIWPILVSFFKDDWMKIMRDKFYE